MSRQRFECLIHTLKRGTRPSRTDLEFLFQYLYSAEVRTYAELLGVYSSNYPFGFKTHEQRGAAPPPEILGLLIQECFGALDDDHLFRVFIDATSLLVLLDTLRRKPEHRSSWWDTPFK